MQPDPKQGEREYFARIGPEGIAHSAGKPFSDDFCAQYLAVMSAVFGILPPPPCRVLEFGCGVGWLSLYLAQRGYEVLGVDIAEEAIVQARASRDARGLPHADFVTADYESFEAPASFDFVIFHDALHHAEDERIALTCAWKSLKAGGSVITVEPGSGHHQTAASQNAIKKYGVHEKDMPPRHIIRLAREIGFSRWIALPHPNDLSHAFYRRTYRAAPNAFERFSRRCLGAFRVLRRIFNTNRQGLVILWK